MRRPSVTVRATAVTASVVLTMSVRRNPAANATAPATAAVRPVSAIYVRTAWKANATVRAIVMAEAASAASVRLPPANATAAVTAAVRPASATDARRRLAASAIATATAVARPASTTSVRMPRTANATVTGIVTVRVATATSVRGSAGLFFVGGAYALCAYGTRKGAIAGTRQYAPFFMVCGRA